TTGCLGLRSTLLQKCVTFCDRKGLLLAFLRILALQHSWWPMSDTSIFRTTGT
ncbi:hypothetical protein GBAR_LOCUS17455, partial [Geodia barretti]